MKNDEIARIMVPAMVALGLGGAIGAIASTVALRDQLGWMARFVSLWDAGEAFLHATMAVIIPIDGVALLALIGLVLGRRGSGAK